MTRSILGKLEQITANKVMREVDGGVELGAITASRFRSFGEGPFVCGGGNSSLSASDHESPSAN